VVATYTGSGNNCELLSDDLV